MISLCRQFPDVKAARIDSDSMAGKDYYRLLRDFGEGKVLAYMSDPAPHWGCNFVFWEHYNRFWLACLELLLK